jgi:hypothetical protein
MMKNLQNMQAVASRFWRKYQQVIRISVIFLMLGSSAAEASPALNIQLLSSPPTQFVLPVTPGTVLYSVTNLSHSNITFTMIPITGVEQVSTDPGDCVAVQTLAANASCTLRLQSTTAIMTALGLLRITVLPQLCRSVGPTPDPFGCYRSCQVSYLVLTDIGLLPSSHVANQVYMIRDKTIASCGLNPKTKSLTQCSTLATPGVSLGDPVQLVQTKQHVYILDRLNNTVHSCAIDSDGTFSTCQDSGVGSIFVAPTCMASNATQTAAYVTNEIVNGEDNAIYKCGLNANGSFSACRVAM